jgi:type II secretory pathway pseudopilin PulG
MIELLIAFVLIGLVVSVAAATILGSFKSATEASSTTSARARAAEAAERFGSDVRTARSIGRDGSKVADPIDLQRAVRTDGPLYDLDGNLLDWRDIVVAAPDRFVFQTDVIDESSGGTSTPECVTWSVDSGANGGTWHVRRVVRAYSDRCAGGGGAVREDDAMTPRGVAPLFTYVVARRSGSACATTPVASPLSSTDRNRVVGVRIDFSGIVQVRDAATSTSLRDEIAIRSRSAADYQLAMECDEG